jgi:hypothetical protein
MRQSIEIVLTDENILPLTIHPLFWSQFIDLPSPLYSSSLFLSHILVKESVVTFRFYKIHFLSFSPLQSIQSRDRCVLVCSANIY